MSNRLSGKVAIVTGAGSGMGHAIAVRYAQEGAKVVLADINESALDTVLAEITSAGGTAAKIMTNMAVEADIDAMVTFATETFGDLDILVNNAGIMDNFKTVEDASDELWTKVLAINLSGPFFAARAAIKAIKARDHGGAIINIASVGGLFGARGGAAYVASKHGLVGLTKNIAVTHGKFDQIRANAIAPGSVTTNIGNTITDPDKLGYAAIDAVGAEKSPIGKPEQVASVAVFLASDESSFINGAILPADGGWTAG